MRRTGGEARPPPDRHPHAATQPVKQSIAAVLLVLVAFLLFSLAFLPWASWLKPGRDSETAAYLTTVLTWSLWLVIAVPVAAAVALRWGGAVNDFFRLAIRRIGDLPERRFAATCALVFGSMALTLSWVLFRHNPHLVDTIAQLFQARVFANGGLTAPAPRELEFFAASHLVTHAGRWFSQYPPGHPALLALGLLVGFPWLVNPLFAAGTLFVGFAAARRLIGQGGAKLAVVFYMISPFVLFMSASYMNHVTTGFFLTLALYAAIRVGENSGKMRWASILGLALAAAATIRPLESAAWAMVLGCWVLARRGWKPAFVVGSCCFIGLLPLLAFNELTTGNPLRFGYTLLWGEGHGLGFHTDPWGEPFTPMVSLVNSALDLQRLNAFLFEWPLPSLLFVLLALVIGARESRQRTTVGLLAGLLLAAPIVYFFYWHRDDYLGPRFLYASLMPAILLTAIGVIAIDQRFGRWQAAFRLTLAATMLFALIVNVPASAGVIAGMEPEMKAHPEAQARDLGVDEAVVFVKTGWGSRLVGRLWGWGVSASEAEQTFRAVDGCRIQSALDSADSAASVGSDSAQVRANLIQQLRDWRQAGLIVEKGLLPDGSVRVDRTRAMSGRCVQEIQQDRSGFTLYGTLVWRNDPWLRSGLVYARYLERDRNRRLLDRYPGRDYYLYTPLSPERGAQTVLVRLGPEEE